MHIILKTENSSVMNISFSACSDSELVYRVRLGETGAFDEIDNRYRGVLYRFLLRFTFNAELAEELTQRVLVRAFEMIEQLKAGDKLVGWLHRIAFRLAVSEVRCKKGVSLDELGEPFTCPVNQIDAEDEKRNLWNCAKEHLSQDEYAILLFRYQDNMTLAEIAERTGKNENSVRVKLHRARRKLRVFL